MPVTPGVAAAAQAQHAQGVLLMQQGRPRAAARVLTAALTKLAGDGGNGAGGGGDVAALRARVLISLGYVDFERHGFAAGTARLDEAAELIERHGITQAAVALHIQRAILALHVGRFDDARAEFDCDAGELAAAPATDRIALLLNRAVVQVRVGALGAARSDLRRCVAESEAAAVPRTTLKAMHNLGFVEFLFGNLTEALRLMNAAEAMDPDVDPGVSLLSKAQVLVEAGLLVEADEAFLAATSIFARDRLHSFVPETELERARCALARGDHDLAGALAGSALRRYRRSGNDSGRRAAELVVLQARVTSGGGRAVLGRARGLHAELVAGGARLPARIAALLVAEAELAGGQVTAAAETARGAGAGRPDDPITGRMHAHYVHAVVDAASGGRPRSARRIRRALDELARYQGSFGSIDLRTASAVHGRRLAELDVSLALATGRAAPVFAAVERARAVSNRLPPVRPPDDPVAAELLADLRRLIESLRSVELDRAASEPLLRRRRELEAQITARTWTRSGAGAPARPAALAAVRARLAERGRTMITYVQSGGGLGAVVTAGGAVRLHELGPAAPVLEQARRARADLDVLAQSRLPGGIRAAVRASLQTSLAHLDRLLLAPIGHGGGPLVLVGTGVLGHLPWSSLSSLRGIPVVVAPSATAWLSSSARVGRVSAGAVTAIAGPGLRRAGDEARAVGLAWGGGDVTTGAGATCAAFVSAMSTASVVHVAAHGAHQPQNPLFSSVRMVDGPVFAHELDGGTTTPEHVVLSACEVGLSTIRPGDEALGLASVLLRLGTRSVVAGVARVDDELAEQTMVAYHRRLAAGEDSASALAAALVEAGSDVVAPFVHFGASDTRTAGGEVAADADADLAGAASHA